MLAEAHGVLARLLSAFLPQGVAPVVAGLLLVVLLAWLIESLNLILGRRLNVLAIRPRTLGGLGGILFAPLLHGGFGHLAANTLPIVVLGALVAFSEPANLLLVSALGWCLSGFGAWLLGASRSRHLGASGIVFAYFGFLLAYGITRQSPAGVGLALAAVVLYGGLIWGVLPFREGRSWQSHLGGAAAGVLCAIYLAPLREGLIEDAAQLLG